MNPDPDTWRKRILKVWASPVYRHNRAHLFFVDPWDQSKIISPELRNTLSFQRVFMLMHVRRFWNVPWRRNAATSRKKTFFILVLFCVRFPTGSYRALQLSTVRAMQRQWNRMSSSKIYSVGRREGREKQLKRTNRRTKGGCERGLALPAD